MRGRAVTSGRRDAGDGGKHFFGNVGDNVFDLAAAFGCEQRGEAGVFQVAAEQGGYARPGHAKRVTGVIVVGQYEDVAEQIAHGARLDLAAVRCACIAAFRVPICEELATRRMFHLRPAPRLPRWDTSVPLLCTRAPLFVVQDRLCSVHAADAFWPLRWRLCVINVKLTTRLAIGRRSE